MITGFVRKWNFCCFWHSWRAWTSSNIGYEDLDECSYMNHLKLASGLELVLVTWHSYYALLEQNVLPLSLIFSDHLPI